jgi:hypothetical protein
MSSPSTRLPVAKVADEVWIATALLHRENPEVDDFSISEIVARAEQEGIAGPRVRPGVRVHATQHCVAGREPNPGRYAMLTESAPGRRRLYRPGDPLHPARRGAKTVPSERAIPERYLYLLDWYESEYAGRGPGTGAVADPILALRGSGRDLWADEDADAYVGRLRSSWE